MSDARAAYDPNRLPWLNDTDAARVSRRAAPRPKAEWRAVAVLALVALIIVAAIGYWAGMRSVAEIEAAAAEEALESEAAVVLPEPVAPQSAPPMVQPAPAQELQPVAPPPVVRMNRVQQAPPEREEQVANVAALQPAEEAVTTEQAIAAAEIPAAPAPQVQAPAVSKPLPRTLWPADVSEGAAGRVVRIGTFSSRLRAKRAWSRIMRVYPGMGRLKATVVSAPSRRNGRTYYRLQFGTTSQAHSAVLCQRMRIVGQSCVVVGTPAA